MKTCEHLGRDFWLPGEGRVGAQWKSGGALEGQEVQRGAAPPR